MIADLLALKASAPAATFAALFIAERLRPAAPVAASGENAGRRLLRNAGMWAAFLAASPLIAFPLTAFAAAHPLWAREGAGALWFVFDLLILDLWTYALHRAYHEVPLLWRLHAPHHFDEHLDTTTAGRIHFGEIVLSAALRAPLIMALAVPIAHVVIYDALLMVAALFHHSNLRLPERAESLLSRMIVTPSLHWVHHHAERRDTDSNYGGVLSLWDRLFATRSRTLRRPDLKIGVEGERDRPLWMLLTHPLTAPAR
jgi:sterol desaturase/sphingolipid hydroxylase (fatty acid hydroxylase superfamily)